MAELLSETFEEQELAVISLGKFRGGGCSVCAVEAGDDAHSNILLIRATETTPMPETISVYKVAATFYSSIPGAEKVSLSLGDDICAMGASLFAMVDNPNKRNPRLVIKLEDKPMEHEFCLLKKSAVTEFVLEELYPFERFSDEEPQVFSPVFAAPFDISEHMTTTLLCMNRKLGEKGLSRKIAGFHKDLMEDNVMARLATIHDAARSFAAITDDASICHEIFQYLNYYKRNGAIIDKSCRVFLALAWESRHYDYMPLIIENVGRILLSHVVSHPNQDHKWYFRLMDLTLHHCRGAWLDDYVDDATDYPTIRNRFSWIRSVQPNVGRRPASRHFPFLRSLFPNTRFPDG